jgi:ribosomal protein L12E/L44/L45/RPP1/RPP2
MTPDGGVIGPKTILAFLRKAGVAEKDIPEVIKDAAAKPATLTTPAAKPTPAVVPPATEKAETQKNPKLTLDKDDRIMNGTKLFNGTIDSKNPLDVGDGATYSGEVKDGKFE